MKWLRRLALSLVVLLLFATLLSWWLMRGSLPALEGTLSLPGLSAPVAIQRDHLGVVTVDAASELDAMRALGYVHAQERFFEMDLMRRNAAGELAALFGPVAVDTDRQHRLHRLRARVTEHLADIAGNRMAVLRAYTDGVNAGLQALAVRPWPYLLLRARPQPWQPADTPLVGYAMYFDLQDSTNRRELAMIRIRQVVPPALFALLERDGTAWDAPLVGEARGDALLPDAATLDLRRLAMPELPRAFVGLVPPSREVGSNNFAVSGTLTRDGRAIVADDMHLGLRAPNIWFRARLRYPEARAAGGKVDVSGFTLPGLPLVVVGSNRHVAWGFTNSYADRIDWMQACGPEPASAGATCTTLDDAQRPRKFDERIEVAGHEPVHMDVEQIAGRPVVDTGRDGTKWLLDWAAYQPGALNLELASLASSTTLEQALAVARRVGIPTQNLVAADSAGHIAWTLAGYGLARTTGCDGSIPAPIPGQGSTSPAVSVPGCGFDSSSMPPVLSGPASRRLWTANNRLLDGEALARAGDGGYGLGARARQIRDDLFATQRFTERDLLAIQLDDRAVFLQRWWRLLQREAAGARSPGLAALAGASRTWQGRASIESTSYRIVRAWRLAVNARLLDGLTAPAQAALGEDFVMPDLPQFEGVAWPLVARRPANLLPRRFANWDALFEDAALEVRAGLEKQGPLAQRTWGERNTARICHPLAMALPSFAKRLLCMPFDPLAGDSNMPRVAAPDFGASERMVVAPGHEADGFIHMPGGQSGHPLSPYWGAGHEDWVHGRATPFLPGKAEHVLRLLPVK